MFVCTDCCGCDDNFDLCLPCYQERDRSPKCNSADPNHHMVLRQFVVHGLSDKTKALMDIDRKKGQSNPACAHCGLMVAQGRVYSTFLPPPPPGHVANVVDMYFLMRVLKHAMSARTAMTLFTYALTAIIAECAVVLRTHTLFTRFW